MFIGQQEMKLFKQWDKVVKINHSKETKKKEFLFWTGLEGVLFHHNKSECKIAVNDQGSSGAHSSISPGTVTPLLIKQYSA